MDLSFVTVTNPGDLITAKSKRQIKQHASKEMWKRRRDKGPAPRIAREMTPRTDQDSLQHLIVYPQSLFSGSRQHVGLTTPVSATSEDDESPRTGQSEKPDARRHGLLDLPVSRFGGGCLDPFTPYPVEIDLPGRRILQHAFDDGLPAQLRYYKDFLYPLSSGNPASFYQFLSLFTFEIHSRYPGVIDNALDQAIAYHRQALTHVNRQLLDPKFKSSDGLITTILGFLRYCYFLADYGVLGIHLQGLHQVINLNGGIKIAFRDKENLVPLLCFTDVDVAYANDLPPTFPLPQKILSSIEVPRRPTPAPQRSLLAQRMCEAWRKQFPENIPAADILNELANTTADLLAERTRVGARFFSSTVTPFLWIEPIVHRLLQQTFRPSKPLDHIAWIQETFRIAALLYLGRLRRFDNEDPLMATLTAKHISRLRKSLGIIGKEDWDELWPLRLWALVMGAMECNQGCAEARKWYLDEMLAMAASLRFRSWREVEKVVKDLLWVDELFHRRADTIWADLAVSLPDPGLGEGS